jgi:hypothetical protein
MATSFRRRPTALERAGALALLESGFSFRILRDTASNAVDFRLFRTLRNLTRPAIFATEATRCVIRFFEFGRICDSVENFANRRVFGYESPSKWYQRGLMTIFDCASTPTMPNVKEFYGRCATPLIVFWDPL